MKIRVIGALIGAAVLAIPLAHAAGLWSNLPLIGGASYCASIIGQGPTQSGTTGTGAGSVTGSTICGSTVPAGPPTFAGTEKVPVDIDSLGAADNGGPPSSALVALVQLGQGPMLDITSPATATIPGGTPWYFLDGAQGSAFTITMPAAPIEGHIQHITCEAATVGALTVAANTNQTLKGNPSAACVAGTGYSWRYQASNTTWYRIQ